MGPLFYIPGGLVFIVCGIWGLILCFRIVQEVIGTIVAVLSLFLAPFLLGIAPWYQGIVNGDWMPLLLVWGGGIIGYILIAIGMWIDKWHVD